MFGIELKLQIYIFIKSIGVGFSIGILYNLFMCLRTVFFKNRFVIIVEDILFFVIACLITFLFILDANFGAGRFYIFAGELIGFVLYYIFPAQLFNLIFTKIFEKSIGIIKRFFFFIGRPFFILSAKINKFIGKQKSKKKSVKIFRKLLHKNKKVLYNNKS